MARLGLLAALAISAASPGLGAEARDRRPAALALDRSGTRLYVANARSGTVSVVDAAGERVLAEHDVGRGLSDLAPAPDDRLLAVDRAGDALILLETDPTRNGVRPVARLDLPESRDPAKALALFGGRSFAVSSPGSRRLTVVDLKPGSGDRPPSLAVSRAIDLPFSPLLLAALPGSGAPRLVVADASGGALAVVDPEGGEVVAVHAFPAHNVRGLVVTPDGSTLVLAHQSLRKLARTTFEDVHWGTLVGNHLRFVPVAPLLRAGAEASRASRAVTLGDTGAAAGDPGPLAIDSAGGLIVAVSGTNELALGAGPGATPRRVAVGRRPSALAVSPDGRTAYSADALDDAVSVVDLKAGARRASIPLGSRPEPDAVARGERLFYDAGLSHDGWMSCQSCHTDGASNGGLADTLGDGDFGAPKRVPTLGGVGATGPWGWNGAFARLEDQVRASIVSTMSGKPPTDGQVDDLTAFLKSLPAPGPFRVGNDEAVARGRVAFAARRCETCHAPPQYTSEARYDVGLADERGRRQFNPPSLRGVGARQPLLHDGRAARLEDVFLKAKHPNDETFTEGEAADLAAFLRTL